MNGSPKSIAVDTGILVALLDDTDKYHEACQTCLRKLPEHIRFYSTEACLTEALHLLPQTLLVKQRLRTLLKLLDISIVTLDMARLERVFLLLEKYNDLPMDFADATLVVACENLDISHVFTLDKRDFGIYKPKHVQRFKLMPDIR